MQSPVILIIKCVLIAQIVVINCKDFKEITDQITAASAKQYTEPDKNYCKSYVPFLPAKPEAKSSCHTYLHPMIGMPEILENSDLFAANLFNMTINTRGYDMMEIFKTICKVWFNWKKCVDKSVELCKENTLNFRTHMMRLVESTMFYNFDVCKMDEKQQEVTIEDDYEMMMNNDEDLPDCFQKNDGFKLKDLLGNIQQQFKVDLATLRKIQQSDGGEAGIEHQLVDEKYRLCTVLRSNINLIKIKFRELEISDCGVYTKFLISNLMMWMVPSDIIDKCSIKDIRSINDDDNLEDNSKESDRAYLYIFGLFQKTSSTFKTPMKTMCSDLNSIEKDSNTLLYYYDNLKVLGKIASITEDNEKKFYYLSYIKLEFLIERELDASIEFSKDKKKMPDKINMANGDPDKDFYTNIYEKSIGITRVNDNEVVIKDANTGFVFHISRQLVKKPSSITMFSIFVRGSVKSFENAAGKLVSNCIKEHSKKGKETAGDMEERIIKDEHFKSVDRKVPVILQYIESFDDEMKSGEVSRIDLTKTTLDQSDNAQQVTTRGMTTRKTTPPLTTKKTRKTTHLKTSKNAGRMTSKPVLLPLHHSTVAEKAVVSKKLAPKNVYTTEKASTKISTTESWLQTARSTPDYVSSEEVKDFVSTPIADTVASEKPKTFAETTNDILEKTTKTPAKPEEKTEIKVPEELEINMFGNNEYADTENAWNEIDLDNIEFDENINRIKMVKKTTKSWEINEDNFRKLVIRRNRHKNKSNKAQSSVVMLAASIALSALKF